MRSVALSAPSRWGSVRTLCALGAVAWTAAAVAEPTFEADIAPLVQSYCIECHNGDKARGDLDLERFTSMDMAIDAIALWQRAGKRVVAGEMPPKRQPQFSDDEKALFLNWIESLKVSETDCTAVASEESMNWYPGYVMSRRLNRHEYERTLRDLLGIPVEVADMFPADGAGGEGFDNNGNALFLSAIQIEKYLTAADLAVEAALPGTQHALPTAGMPGRRRAVLLNPRERGRARAHIDTSRVIIPAIPGGKLSAREAARLALEEFARRAWRRPVTPEEIERLLTLYDEARERGARFEDAVKTTLKAALVSPHFLFLSEPEPELAGNYPLGDYPLASRLSYFLWSTMPDAELLELAHAGRLQDESVLRAQVLRMMADPKAAALGELFAMQWLEIAQLAESKRPDEARFPEFDDSLRDAMQAEAAMVFHRIVREDRSLLELIDADYTYANERLASLYGLEGVQGDHMQLVALNDPNRGGVTGMAAVLTATSHPLRTSPVLRGKWVLEQLLGDRVPPPPPDAGTLPEDDVHPDGLTFREQLELHRKNPDCASCHDRMDPLGFGLENFDPIGRWREDQAGQPIDVTGALPSGETFAGPHELKRVLMARKDAFTRNLSRKMLGYALGRALTRLDECVIDDCMEALKEHEYRPSVLIAEIVVSHPFRHRFSGRGRAVSSEEAS